jgi:uncharacterized protein YbaA (DUF1428 family)
MSYIDVCVIPVPTDRLAEYKKLARKMAKVWREHGALQYVEAVADDAPAGKITSFPCSVKAKEGETVVVAYMLFPSRRVRVSAMKKVMADPRAKFDPASAPFDMKRMYFGGFRTMIEA